MGELNGAISIANQIKKQADNAVSKLDEIHNQVEELIAKNKELETRANFWKNLTESYIEPADPIITLRKTRQVARDYTYKLRQQGRISFSEPEEGELPSIHVVRRTLPEVWEDTMMALIGIGQEVHTHYDPGFQKGKFESFPSLEATVMMHIQKPFEEPSFHKHYLGGWLGVGDYIAEIEGAKDHWVLDPKIVVDLLKKGKFKEIKGHTGWLYSYSQRLRAYPYLDIEAQPQTINQLQSVIDNLIKNPTSRSAQAITWDPRFDHNDGQIKFKTKNGRKQKANFDDYHAPCLQRLWFRLEPFKKGYKLNTNTHWRSRDHPKAVPQNIKGILEGIVEPLRIKLQAALKQPVERGRYVDINDSLHVYGHYLDPRMQGKDAEQYLFDVFKVAAGEPLEGRLILPGTSMYKIMQEDIEKEYKERKADPDKGRNI